VEDIQVASWNELNEQLYQGSWREPLERFRSSFAFRGMSRVEHDLQTSLMQLGGPYAKQEGHLLRNFRKYALRSAVPEDSVWNWLALAQHHGLPTRLLDWTYSPYVALHFATYELADYNADGVVWCVDYTRTNTFLPKKLRSLLHKEGSDVFTAEMLGRAASTLTGFDGLGAGDFRFDLWLAKNSDCFRRIVFPARLKWEVRDKLDQANITERVLFPGLDGLSRWLKRYYSPKGT
jgi:hypothetical protein